MKIQQLPRDRMRRHAARWHDTKMSGRTYCLTPGQALPGNVSLPDALGKLIGDCQTGAFLFWSAAQAHLVVPPFPVSRSAEYDGWHAGPLQSLLDRPRTIAVLLLRLGGMAAGVFEGERLIASKVGTRFVKGRHKKGGSSAGRFARRREGQARALFDKACDTFREVVEPHRSRLEHVILGGDRHTLQDFEKRCPHLATYAPIRLRRVLNVPDPRLKVLESVSRLLYASQVATFRPGLESDQGTP